jgi:hypothetical protein
VNGKPTTTGPLWALLVTGGTIIEYPPELYVDEDRATNEAERWAWVLSGAGWLEIERPFPGRWQIGEHDVRLASLRPAVATSNPWWIGTFWDRGGMPDPEALLLPGRQEALDWVRRPPVGSDSAIEMQETDWFLSATYLSHGEEEYAVAHLAKLVV